MPVESSVNRLVRVVVRGRTLIFLAVADVLLFLIANIAYGPGNDHGFRLGVSNVTWALFLIGALLLIALGIAVLVQAGVRRTRRPASTH
jgi:hypothetical protein